MLERTISSKTRLRLVLPKSVKNIYTDVLNIMKNSSGKMLRITRVNKLTCYVCG